MNDHFTQSLAQLRADIDALDSELIALLKKRIGIIHRVAALKREHTPGACHIRSGREGAMHKRIFDTFAGSDFPPAAALSIWRQIIGASTHLESPITVAVAGDEALRWHAREYFGRSVTFLQEADIASALRAVEEQRATIALLPQPNASNIAAWAELQSHPALQVFASLPMVLAEGEEPTGCAVAAITPEPSGEDVTLLLLPAGEAAEGCVLAENATHMLVAVEGFHNDPRRLGVMPKPITDSTLKPW